MPKSENNTAIDNLSASEALFGFCGWLMTRKETTIMNSSEDVAVIAELVKLFCDTHKLSEPRHGWDTKLKRIEYSLVDAKNQCERTKRELGL